MQILSNYLIFKNMNKLVIKLIIKKTILSWNYYYL